MRAFDGDVDTAWRAGALGAAVGERLRVDLDEPITADHINLVQPLKRRSRPVHHQGAHDVFRRRDGDE